MKTKRKAKRARRNRLEKLKERQFKRWMRLRERKVEMVMERKRMEHDTSTVPDANALERENADRSEELAE